MAFFNWDDSYSVQIASIDEQHKKLISLLNEYYDGIQKQYSEEHLNSLVNGLADYTVYHFSHEEKLMTLHKYPDYEVHKKEHDAFIEKIKAVQKKIEEKKLLLPIEVTNFLKEWISLHVKKVDKSYSQFFVEKGVV